jgi:hypothetical protein
MADNFIHQTSNTVTLPADTTLASYIDSRVTLDSSLTNGTLDAAFNFVTASNFTATANGSGDNFKIGNDAYIGDINVSNTLGLRGIQDATQGYIKFGASGPLVGFASTAALPSAGVSGAVTGSLIQKGANLYFYNGTSGTAGGVKGWATVI